MTPVNSPADSKHPPTRPESRGLIAAAAAAITLATLAAYHGSFSVPFFFDDTNAVVDNPTIRHLAHIGDVLSPPNDGGGVTGRPMVNLSLALNYALGGTAAPGYHALNLLLHALAGLTLFGLVRRTLLLPAWHDRFGAGALPVAFVAALWWTVHPLQTESVTCVVQRTELLVGLFYLLTFYCLARGSVCHLLNDKRQNLPHSANTDCHLIDDNRIRPRAG